MKRIEYPTNQQTHASTGRFACKVGALDIFDNGSAVQLQPITAANKKPLYDATLTLPRDAATLRAIAAEILFLSEEI